MSQSILSQNTESQIHNPAYLSQLSSKLVNALKTGSDVLQLDNGDLIVTELKTAKTYLHTWDVVENKFKQAVLKRGVFTKKAG